MDVPILELAFHVRLDFDDGPRTRFVPEGTSFTRGFVGVAGGEVWGPRMSGEVIPRSGGDWPRFWDSGLVEFEAHYMFQTDDGAPVYIHNRGIAWSDPAALARIERGERVAPDSTYCRITPRFETPRGPHDWLNRTVFVGVAERRGNSTFFDYYAVG